MRYTQKDWNTDVCKEAVEVFFDSAATAKTQVQLDSFLRNLLTENEQLMLGRRLLIARMLLAGIKQNEIRYKLDVSPNTVWKVNKWLMEQIPEYGQTLKQIKEETDSRWEEKKGRAYSHYNPLSFYALKRKYPAHFLLFNIADDFWDWLNTPEVIKKKTYKKITNKKHKNS